MGVMSVKRATQTFSSAEQTSGAKPASPNTAGAADFQKAFGDKNLGEVLNNVSDPNFVDPSKKMRTTGNNALDKDAFLKLMLAQMKHQDPTNPMQSHEMASQLAQFTSLEQLNNINSTLEGMKNSQSPNANYQALAFIGKKVTGDSSKLTRGAGDTRHGFNFELSSDAAAVKVTVKDAGGNKIRDLEFNNLKKGSNSVEWNGLMEDGMAARPGEYKFVVEAKATNGAKVFATTSFEGRITGLNYTSEGPVLMVGGQTIKLSDVKKIEDPGSLAFAEQVPTQPAAAQASIAAAMGGVSGMGQSSGGAKQGVAVSEPIPPAEEPENEGNIGNIPMSRQLLNDLQQTQSGQTTNEASVNESQAKG